MNDYSKKIAAYWRNSLADASSGGGLFQKIDHFMVTTSELSDGQIKGDLLAKCFKNESLETRPVQVTIRPYLYKYLKIEHGKILNGYPKYVTPVVIHATLQKDGYLYPKKYNIPRDLLSPQSEGTFTIGEISESDNFIAQHSIKGFEQKEEDETDKERAIRHKNDWDDCLAGCKKLYESVTQFYLEREKYILCQAWLLTKNNTPVEAQQHLINLYDFMVKKPDDFAHFENFTAKESKPVKACIPSFNTFSSRLAHSSDTFSLTASQRAALSHFMLTRNNDILAVNGPPGTGKTTLLLSTVSTLWAEAALAKSKPPLIIACSSNNNAVTNIIQAFGKNFSHGRGAMAGRWLPDIKSFGSYFPSQYRKLDEGKFQTKAFFDKIESVGYIWKAASHYLKMAKQAFPEHEEIDLDTAVTLVHKALSREVDKLKRIETTWQELTQIRSASEDALNQDINQLKNTLGDSLKTEGELEKLYQTFNNYISQQSWTYHFLFRLPVISNRKRKAVKALLKDNWPKSLAQKAFSSIADIKNFLTETLEKYKALNTALGTKILNLEAVMQKEQAATDKWAEVVEKLTDLDEPYSRSIDDVDSFVDMTIRFNIFLLTTHYWEGCWLQEMNELIENRQLKDARDKKNRSAVMTRWLRRMKITPCSVSTCYMLPKHMQFTVGHNNDGTWTYDYLYHAIDLLIIDEAGQVLPEVAGTAFALSKKSLVIGDTLQLEPVWSIKRPVDIGNLMEKALLPSGDNEKAYESLAATGITASEGSAMKIAQRASIYHYDKDMSRGMYLYEHRRCYDEIISYCNKLCYQGKLQPLRGKAPENNLYPAMAYLHINGRCQKSLEGSSYNKLEATTIALWVKKNRDKITEHYQQKLTSVLAIITPFTAQVKAIKAAFIKHGIPVSHINGNEKAPNAGVVIGTTHTFQGAEKNIIIFSSVYSKHQDGRFIDKKTCSLNVAVSRAKDSFLVFGDMDTFEIKPKSSPRGLLARCLTQNQKQQLHFPYQSQIRQDLATGSRNNPYLLQNFEAHDQFLLSTLKASNSEVHIFTPWIKSARIKNTEASVLMIECVKRSVQINIYTSPCFNISYVNGEKDVYDIKELEDIKHYLTEHGIKLHYITKMHSKLLICDNKLYCAGSFNWFSASRNRHYANLEHSLVYSGNKLQGEIDMLKKALKERMIESADMSRRVLTH